MTTFLTIFFILGMWTQFMEDAYNLMPKTMEEYNIWFVAMVSIFIIMAAIYTVIKVINILQGMVTENKAKVNY